MAIIFSDNQTKQGVPQVASGVGIYFEVCNQAMIEKINQAITNWKFSSLTFIFLFILKFIYNLSRLNNKKQVGFAYRGFHSIFFHRHPNRLFCSNQYNFHREYSL